MLDLYDRATGDGCSCCGTVGHRPPPAVKAEATAPLEEIRCDACGRVLYTLPAEHHAH